MDSHLELRDRIAKAKREQQKLALSSSTRRNEMLLEIAKTLQGSSEVLFAANQIDLVRAQAEQLGPALQKRLLFDQTKLNEVCTQLRHVATLQDPIGQVLERRLLDEGLLLERVHVPIGMIAMIFEARPDALVQIVSLALKSGNGIILKGGREANATNRALVNLIVTALSPFTEGSDWLILIEDRADVQTLLEFDDLIDLIIPRGSKEFVRYILNSTKIAVLGHADGLCSIYVDQAADLSLALDVVVDAKCQYPAVCNAVETLLVHQAVAKEFLPQLHEALTARQVLMHGDERTQAIIEVVPATEEVWSTEFLALELAIGIVDSLDAAIDHISRYGSHHTDAIITANASTAREFMARVDSADLFWNCSTRFADGYRFGLGAEVGIGTGKIHARGPVGLAGLMTTKWLLAGSGHIVKTYSGDYPKAYLHQDMDLDGPSLLQG